MSSPFLHQLPNFKKLIEITAQEEKIDEPYLVEKDYWIMHVLWSLQQLNLAFHLKGGTSLSKGFGCIHRFSEDIDIKIEPNEELCGFKVYSGKNQDEKKHRDSRENYFNWISEYLTSRVHGITEAKRDAAFDDQPKFRNGGIRLLYQPQFEGTEGIKNGVLLEVGFDRTAPNQPCEISSWAYERARQASEVKILDNRALAVLCYEPKYTFVEKLQAVVRKYRLYKEGKQGANLPINFIRHYYDLYQLIERDDVQAFIGSPDYEAHKIERFAGDDTKVANSDALKLEDPADRAVFESVYTRSESLYFKGRPTLTEILARIGKDIDRL